MSAVDWRAEIETFAGPFDGNRKSWLARAARLAGASYRSIKALYYGEVSDPKHSVAVGVLGAAEQARKEAAQLAAFYESIAGDNNAGLSNLSGKEIALLLGAARTLRGVDRA